MIYRREDTAYEMRPFFEARAQPPEIIAFAFLLLLLRITPSVILPDTSVITSKPPHGFFFSFAFSPRTGRGTLGDLPLPFAILSHLSPEKRENGE